MDANIFEPVLEKGESIVKIYKPDKKKYWFSINLWTLACTGWFAFIILVGAIGGGIEEGFVTNFFEGLVTAIIAVLAAIAFHLVLFFIFVYPFAKLNYKNRFYAYTNKRILIRRGIFGVDYLSLEFKSLTATIVKVSLIDKIVKRNTGTLIFGSPSSPIGGMASYGNNNSNKMFINPYLFAHIYKPYDTLREIKEIIDSNEK